MAESIQEDYRDGTSQMDRLLAALNPDYIAIDERSLKDNLEFARQYAGELKYFDENGQEIGDWRAFMEDIDDDEVIAFINDSASIPEHRAVRYQRPHFVLFLTFLKLLEHARHHLNTLTARHLNFYFQDYLRLQKKPSLPDRVNILLELARNKTQFELPAGVSLDAGKDSDGKNRIYQTQTRIVVNQARIAQLRSLYADKQIIGIREAWQDKVKNSGFRGRILYMLKIVYGMPVPGGEFPGYTYIGTTLVPVDTSGTRDEQVKTLGYEQLLKQAELVNFVKKALFMGFSEFNELMRFKKQRDEAEEDWLEINGILNQAGLERDSSFEMDLESQDFNGNFQRALGFPPYEPEPESESESGNFDGIRDVQNIDELYRQLKSAEVQEDLARLNFFEEKLHKMSEQDFVKMMLIKIRMDAEWSRIIEILEQAGRKKSENLTLTIGPESPHDFNQYLSVALGTLDFSDAHIKVDSADSAPNPINQYHEALLTLENYFFMPASDFALFMTTVKEMEEPEQNHHSYTTVEWERVYDILEEAYKKKVFTERHAALESIKIKVSEETEGNEESDPKAVISNMAKLALGDSYRESSGLSVLDQLQRYIKHSDDLEYLSNLPDKENILPGDWERAYEILKIAWRNREGHDPVAYMEEWQNLYPAFDATDVYSGVNEQNALPRWKTFGRAPINEVEGPEPPQSFGWAVSSPSLMLAQGKREITLSLIFAKKSDDLGKIIAYSKPDSKLDLKLHNMFEIKLSGGMGWLFSSEFSVAVVNTNKSDSNAGNESNIGNGSNTADDSNTSDDSNIANEPNQLKFIISFDGTTDPSAAPGDYTDIVSTWPVLCITLRNIFEDSGIAGVPGRHKTHYPLFKNLRPDQITVEIEVEGLTDFKIANDEAILDPKSPFEPFTAYPVVGSRFYLGHPELIYKKLDTITFNLEWMGLPKSLTTHYVNYNIEGNSTINNDSFKASIELIDSRQSKPLFEDSASLFKTTSENENISSDNTISLLNKNAAEQGLLSKYIVDLTAINSDQNPKYWDRYMQWELEAPDFQHGNYPIVANKKAFKLAAIYSGIEEKPDDFDATKFVVQPPYTPKIKHLTIDYKASFSIDLNKAQEARQPEQLFHIYPFGYHLLEPGDDNTRYFMPQFNYAGELYIGIEKLNPPQHLSLLMQMVEGSADPDLEPEPVEWSYLSANRWVSLEDGHIVSDMTRGLINSGIIQFKLPVSQPNTILPAELFWLRAAIKRNANSVCDTVAIHTQVVSAVFIDHDNASDHLSTPLPVGSIKRLLNPQPEIKAIHQPYTSFGGKTSEQEQRFNTWVSERLRHKQRALTVWDYEHLILEQFPEIYKCKCLPTGQNGEAEQPGMVEIVVIPEIRKRQPFDPFEPKAPANLIKDIASYLDNIMPIWSTVEVKNPHYITVKTRLGVRFNDGYHQGYYKQVLNDDINRFLSPWAYEDGADIVIGGRIYANSLINFIDEREYVDYVTNFKFFRSYDGVNFLEIKPSGQEGYWVETGERVDGVLVNAWSQGVLVAAREHEIDLIEDNGYEEKSFVGINYMKVELDFIVGPVE